MGYKTLILLFFITIKLNANSQNVFSKYFDNNMYGNRITDIGGDLIILPDSGYIFPSMSSNMFEVDTLGFAVTYIQVIRTNKSGDLIYQKLFRKKNFSVRVLNIAKIDDSHFILAGHIFDLVKYKTDSTGAEILLVKINLNGDTLWTKTLGIGDGDELVSRIISTSDGGFAIFGQTCNKKETNCDYFLMKVDSNGNNLWQNTYSYTQSSWEIPESILEDKEKGFILVGHTSGAYVTYIVKTDSAGTMLWQKRINNYKGYASRTINSITKSKNNTYLISGVVANNEIGKGYFIRLDSVGNVIFETVVGKDDSYTIFMNIIERNNTIYAQGETKDYLKPPQTDGYHTSLYAFTSAGDPLWRRTYPDSLVPNRRYLIYDMKSTLDNGFAMIGFGMDPKATNPQNNQDVWFLKVDSNGCLYQPCVDMTVGVDDDKEIKSNVLLFPNPCKDVLNIMLDEEIAEVSVYNSIGQLQLQESWVKNNRLNIEEVPSGFLLVKIKTKEGKFYSEKVWKE